MAARSIAYRLADVFAIQNNLQTSLRWPRGTTVFWQNELVRLQAMVAQRLLVQQQRNAALLLQQQQIQLLNNTIQQVQTLQNQLGEPVSRADRGRIIVWQQRLTRLMRKDELRMRELGVIQRSPAVQAQIAEQVRQEAEIQKTRDRQKNLLNSLKFKQIDRENGIIDFDHTFSPAIESTDIELVIDFVKFILRRRNRNDGFIIKLIGIKRRSDGAVVLEQKLNSEGVILISDAEQAYNFLRTKVDDFTSDGMYTFTIDIVRVRIIPANSGGCNPHKHDKILTLGKFKLKSKVVKNNNCFFVYVKKYIGLKKTTKKPCNSLRDKLQLQHNTTITVGQAFELFKLCRKDEKYQIRIIDNDSGTVKQTDKFETTETKNIITLFLMDGHYWQVVSEDRRCGVCGKKWKIKHKCIAETTSKCRKCNHFHPSKKECNPNHITYYQAKILKSKNRYVLGCTREEELDNHSVVHYDLETHPRVNKTHQPYIVGYCLPPADSRSASASLSRLRRSDPKFEYFTGKDCCEKFVKRLVEYADTQYNLVEVTTERELKIAKIKCLYLRDIGEESFRQDSSASSSEQDYTHGSKKKESLEKFLQHKYVRKISGEGLEVKYYKKIKKNIYLNAFNGANFDHYFLLKIFMKAGYEIKDFVLKGGSIFKVKFKNIIFMDIRKHTTGSFKDNLKTMGCKLAKGDFNHARGDDWNKMSVEDQKLCLDYLKIDVMGLKELYEKMNSALHSQYKVNMHSFFSTSHTTFTLWRAHLNKESPTLIKIPNKKEESVFRPACFGGRCYPSKKSFESIERDDYLKGKIDYDKVKDYLVDLDVVSLYPSVMQLYDYPVGEVKELEPTELEEFNRFIRENKKCKKAGIYYIKYITNKYLAHAILPHRTPQGLRWTLEDNEGYFTSIDIDNAIKYGYKIEIINPNDNRKFERIVYHKKCGKKHIDQDYWAANKHKKHKCHYCSNKEGKNIFFNTEDECIGIMSLDIKRVIGFYWEKSKKIYKTYIEELFEKKKMAKRGSPERALAKLFMNGLYGKMIQRPIADKTVWAKNISDFWKFYKNHKIEDIEVINGYMYLTGRSRDEAEDEKCISKPTQLGAFILGYTRRLMLKYYSQSNPYFDISMYANKPDFEKYQKLQVKNDFYYTDTDAIQIHHDNLIPLSKELGGIDDDLQEYAPADGATKIMRGIWIAPKLYMLEFITSDSENPMSKKDKELVEKGQCDIRIINDKKIYYTYRGKGVPTDKLNVEAFEIMKSGGTFSTQRDFQMKKNNVRLNRPQLEKEVQYFSITHHVGKETERILNKRSWNGREWKSGGSVPLRPLGN